LVFPGILFADCTGDGTVDFLAGADYNDGRESRDVYNEPIAPLRADKKKIGMSLSWYVKEQTTPSTFPTLAELSDPLNLQ
jgi:hypothetical protein